MDLNAFYDKAYNWVLTVGPRLLVAILFFVLAQWVIKLLKKWMNRTFLKKDLNSSLRPFLISLTTAVLQILVILVILQILSLELTIFTAIVGGISVAAGLALSGTLQNFASGILILLLKPYRVGDTVFTQGHEGIVKSIQIFHTVITTYDNKTVIIPNSKLSNDVIVNLSLEGMRRLDLAWKVGFGFDLEKMKAIIHDTINNFPGIRTDRAPDVNIAEIQTDGYKVELNVWLNAEDYYHIKAGFQEKLLNNLKESQLKLNG